MKPTLEKIRKTLRWIGIHLKWLAYHRATIWERMAYDEGVARGMHCEHVKVEGPQMTQVVKFHPGVTPWRRFLTYREFIEIHQTVQP